MKLHFTPRATQDLLDIADYIRERNPNAHRCVYAPPSSTPYKILCSSLKRVGVRQS